MSLEWITDNLFPNFVQNLSIIASILGTVITFCVWLKTNKLYKLYNEKSSSFYITDKIKQLYKKYNQEITKLNTDEIFKENQLIIWELIKEITGVVSAFESSRKPIGQHILQFKLKTSDFSTIPPNKLKKDDAWDYYKYLTELHQVLQSIQELDVRKVS